MNKFIVVDIYEASDEEMKTHNLKHKKRAKVYSYEEQMIMDFGLECDVKIGQFIYKDL